MNEEAKTPVSIPLRVERRRQKTAEWSASEVMRILRKRAAKAAAMRKVEEAITDK